MPNTFVTALLLGVPREGGASGTVFIIQMALIFAIFWFLLIRPQRKAQKRHQEMLEALKKGDEIVTEGGVIGQVLHIDGDRVTIRTGENTRLLVARGKIARVGGAQEQQ